MPLFGDLKKIFFGAKSVAKNQGRKAAGAAGELADDLKEQAGDLADDARDFARDVVDKAPEYVDRGKEALEDLRDKIWSDDSSAADKGRELRDATASPLDDLAAPDPLDEPGLELGDLTMQEVPETEAPKSGSIDFEADLIDDPAASLRQAGEGLRNAAAAAWDKAKDATAGARAAADQGLDAAAHLGNDLAGKVGKASEAVGKEVLEKGDVILGRAAELGADLKGKASDFIDHASAEAEKMRLEDTIEEAKRAAEQAEARARAFDGKEAARDTSESTLSGTDSFFDRAARFAEGDYHDEGGKDIRVLDNLNEASPKEKGGQITGFADNDGDGDGLIDDAEIVEEE